MDRWITRDYFNGMIDGVQGGGWDGDNSKSQEPKATEKGRNRQSKSITESSYLSSVAPLLEIRIDRDDVGDGCGRGQSGGWCGSESPTKRR